MKKLITLTAFAVLSGSAFASVGDGTGGQKSVDDGTGFKALACKYLGWGCDNPGTKAEDGTGQDGGKSTDTGTGGKSSDDGTGKAISEGTG